MLLRRRVSRIWPGPLELASPTQPTTDVRPSSPYVGRSNAAGAHERGMTLDAQTPPCGKWR
eukprot:15439754-Alexandrium_andersonii.AAC.1